MKYLARIVNFLFHRNEEIIICDQCHWSKYVHGWHRCQPRSRERKGSISIASTAIILFLAFVLLAVSAQAQTPPTQHFVISANAAGYGGKEAVSIVGTGFQLTKYVSVAYGRISNPTDTTKPIYNVGDLNVTYELGDLLPAKAKKALVFDTTNWLVTGQFSAGKVTAPSPTVDKTGRPIGPNINRIAEGLGVYLSRPVTNNVQMTCGFRFLHGAGLGTTWVKVPTVGLNFTF